MRLAFAIVVAICLFGFIHHLRANEFADQTWDHFSDRSAHAALEGKPIPALEVDNWINGTVTPEDMKGKVVVIDFYATWCGPCMAAIPHNNELLAKYSSQGLIIVGVCTSEQGQDLHKRVAETQHIQYPTARDSTLASAKTWHVSYYPTYAVIDRKGIVRVIGLQPQYLEDVVKKLLDEK